MPAQSHPADEYMGLRGTQYHTERRQLNHAFGEALPSAPYSTSLSVASTYIRKHIHEVDWERTLNTGSVH